MNAISDQIIIPPSVPDWDSTFMAVNAWRGECMHHFSVAEHAVTKTLLVLDSAKPEGSIVRLRHLIGQRFEDLAAALDPEGPFGERGKIASAALANFRTRHEAFRTLLCHGTVKVSVERNGNWVLVLRTLSIRGRQADQATEVLEQSVAQVRLADLKRDGQKLAAALGQIRKTLTTT